MTDPLRAAARAYVYSMETLGDEEPDTIEKRAALAARLADTARPTDHAPGCDVFRIADDAYGEPRHCDCGFALWDAKRRGVYNWTPPAAEARPAEPWGSDVFESECRCGASWGQVHATDCLTEMAERQLDHRSVPAGHAAYREPELPASEWRAAYFVLAEIAQKQLDACHALAADTARPVDQGVQDVQEPPAADTARPGLGDWPDRAWLISHWVGHRCGYVDCRVTEQHEHGGGPSMREMTPEERVALAATAERPLDAGGELGRLLAERDRLIAQGVDPAELLRPLAPPATPDDVRG